MKNFRSSQPFISINFCTEFSKAQVSIVKSLKTSKNKSLVPAKMKILFMLVNNSWKTEIKHIWDCCIQNCPVKMYFILTSKISQKFTEQ